MNKVDVVFLYEHAARELDVACAISSILQKKYDLSVEIVQWPAGFLDALYNVRPRLVVLPFCYTEKSYPRLLAAWRKSVFFNMTWEQIFYSGNKTAKTPRGEFSVNHVIHHAWSKSYANFLKEHNTPEKNIYLNGQPAYKLYDHPYRQYFQSREQLAEKYGLDPGRRWVFFPENYNWAFYTQSTLDQFIQNGQSAEDVYAMREFCRKSLAETVKWCAEIAATKKVEVILRPRPSTSLNDFLDFVSSVLPSLPNGLHILKEESVRDWVLASDLVVSSYSTSLLEAAIAGKPVFILEPYPTPASLKVDWHGYLPHLEQKQDFLDACLNVTQEKAGDLLGKWAREQMMDSGDAISNLAGILSRLLVRKTTDLPPVASWQAAIPDVKLRARTVSWVFAQRVRAVLGLRKAIRVPAEYMNDFLERDAIRKKILKWSAVLFGAH